MNNSSWSFWNPKSYCSPDPASTGEPADWPNAGDMECWLLRDVCCQLLVWTDSSRPFCAWPITLRPALESIAERDPGDVGWPEAQICQSKRRLMMFCLSKWEKLRQNQLDDVGCDMDITAWQLAWSVLIQIMPPNLRLGGLCEPDLIKEGTAKSRRRSGRSELDPWNFSKVERCWKADKTWEVQNASAKCKLPGLCICRWHQHMQLARPAFCQKTQNSAGTWFDFPICRVVERLFAKWSYTNFVSLYTPAFLTIPDLRDGDKVNAMRKTVMLRQKDVLKSCRFVGSSRELVLLTLDQCGA